MPFFLLLDYVLFPPSSHSTTFFILIGLLQLALHLILLFFGNQIFYLYLVNLLFKRFLRTKTK